VGTLEVHLQRVTKIEKSCGCAKNHGQSEAPTYSTWKAMMARCYSPKSPSYANYGGRGIFVVQEWHDFAVFLRDMGERPFGCSIDRVDGNGPYAPWNCKWSNATEQALNRRTNIVVEINGVSRPLSVWAEILGANYSTVKSRVRRGWGPLRALEAT
jgi:hypothetical protein